MLLVKEILLLNIAYGEFNIIFIRKYRARSNLRSLGNPRNLGEEKAVLSHIEARWKISNVKFLQMSNKYCLATLLQRGHTFKMDKTGKVEHSGFSSAVAQIKV